MYVKLVITFDIQVTQERKYFLNPSEQSLKLSALVTLSCYSDRRKRTKLSIKIKYTYLRAMILRCNHQRCILCILSAQEQDLYYHNSDEMILQYSCPQKLGTTVNRLHHAVTMTLPLKGGFYPLLSRTMEKFLPPVDLLFLGPDKTSPL